MESKGYPYRPLSVWVEEIAALKRQWPDRRLWASIMAGMDRDAWAKLAVGVQDAGADVIELNVSCPNGMPDRGMGALIGQSPELTAEVTGWVKNVARVPVVVKLTPNVTDIVQIAQAATDAGADGFCAINTVAGVAGVDLATLSPLPSVDGNSCAGGISGPAIRPVALRAVAEVARATGRPVAGCGGIADWESAAEFFALGAGLAQLCTEPMRRGFGMIDSLTKGLASYLHRRGLAFPELVGAALPRLKKHEDLSREHHFRPGESEDCAGCGVCVTACRDGGFEALRLEVDGDRRTIRLDAERCGGCGLCELVCVCHPRQPLKSREKTGAGTPN